MAKEKKNEKWDGYTKSPMKDPIFGDDGFTGVKIQADTTKKFVKEPKEHKDDLITLNPHIAFLNAIGQDIYDTNFYAKESLESVKEDTQSQVLVKVKNAIIDAISKIEGYTVQDQVNYPEAGNELTFYSGDKDDDVYMIKIEKVFNAN